MPLQPMSDNFDINVDWDAVPDSDIIPESTYELLVRSAELGWTATEKLAVEVTCEVGAGELEGKRLRSETFVLGNDEDNQGVNPDTRVKLFGWMNLKKLCNAVGVRYEQSLRTTTGQLEGKRFLGTVKVVKQAEKNRDGSSNQYAGQEQNRVTAYYPVGHSLQIPSAGGQRNSTQPMPSMNTPQPQRRMSAMEVLAQQQSSQVSEVSTTQVEEDDIPL